MAAYPAWAEGLAVLTGAIGVWQSVRERVSTWVWGQASVMLYIYILYQERLFGALVLQAAYTISNVYGFWEWMRAERGSEIGDRESEHITIGFAGRGQLMCVGVAVALAAGAMAVINLRLQATLPVPDAALSALSLGAQYLLARKRTQTWLIWIVADAGYALLYVYQGLWMTAGLYALFVGMAVVGWRRWREVSV